MTSYLNNDYDIMNYFAKFENFLPQSIIIPSFMTVGSQMPELHWGGGGGGGLCLTENDQNLSLHFSFVAYNKENLVLSYIFLAIFFLFNSDLLYQI